MMVDGFLVGKEKKNLTLICHLKEISVRFDLISTATVLGI